MHMCIYEFKICDRQDMRTPGNLNILKEGSGLPKAAKILNSTTSAKIWGYLVVCVEILNL